MRGYSSASGSFTLMIISARFQTSSADGTRVAPARSYSTSAMPEPAPAPASTSTRCPAVANAFAPAGTKPTRCSRALISFGTPMIATGLPEWGRTIHENGIRRGSALGGPLAEAKHADWQREAGALLHRFDR